MESPHKISGDFTSTQMHKGCDPENKGERALSDTPGLPMKYFNEKLKKFWGNSFLTVPRYVDLSHDKIWPDYYLINSKVIDM